MQTRISSSEQKAIRGDDRLRPNRSATGPLYGLSRLTTDKTQAINSWYSHHAVCNAWRPGDRPTKDGRLPDQISTFKRHSTENAIMPA
jgi:hypothetical protein